MARKPTWVAFAYPSQGPGASVGRRRPRAGDNTWAARSIGGPLRGGPADGLRRYRRVATRVRVGFSPCAGGPTSEAAAPEWNPRLYGRASPRGPRRRLPVHARGGRGLPTPGTRFPVYSPAGNRMRGARLRASPHPSFPLPAASTRALSPAWARSAPSTSPSRVHRTAPNREPASRGDAPGPPASPRVPEKQKPGPRLAGCPKYHIDSSPWRWTAAAAAAANSRPLPPSATSRPPAR